MLAISDVEHARTRDDLVAGYVSWIRAMREGKGVPACADVNAAIIERWSISALEHIKRKAWQCVEAEGVRAR